MALCPSGVRYAINSGPRTCQVESLVPMFRACVLTLYGDRSPSSGRSQACRLPLHTGNTSGKSTRPARLRHCAAITLSEQSAASACLAVQSGSDAAVGGWDDEPAATFD